MAADQEVVGRERELEAVQGFFTAPRAMPAALLLEGPAGVGKTTIWQAGVDRARATGYRVLSCRPADAEVHLLYGGLSDLLMDHVSDVLATLPRPQRRAIEVVLLLAEDEGRPGDQRALAAGVLGVLRALAVDQPLLLAVDDAQWLDPASVLVVEYALRRLRGVNVSVFVTSRSDPLDASSAERQAAGLDLRRALARSPQRLAVGGLSPGALHQVLRDRTGHPFPRPLLRRIHEATAGNPFYAIEIARAMEDQQSEWTAGEPLSLSASQQELLASRFTGLPREVRDALFVAATASQPTLTQVEAVLGMPVKEGLTSAIEAGILRSVTPRVEFAHPLLAAAAQANLGLGDRRRWHQRLAEELPDLESRARHLALARPGPDLEIAHLLHEAGRDAHARGAPAVAGELLAEAIRRLPDGQLLRRAPWSVEAARVLRQAGDHRLAREMLDAVIGDLPAGPVRADALLVLASLVRDEPGGDVLERTLVERALSDSGEDAMRRALALLELEMWERHRDRFDRALPLAREALTLAERAGDRALLAAALTRTADLEVLLGLADDPIAHFRRALAAGDGLQLDAWGDSPPAMLAACLIRAGRVAEARPLLVEERARLQRQGDEASLLIVCLFLAELEWLAGDWDRARSYGEEGRLVADQAESRLMEGALLALIALVDASRGEVEAARATGRTAAAVCEEVGDRSYAAYARQILGFLELSVGNPAAAGEEFAAYPMGGAIEGTKRLSFVGDQIEALVLLGLIDEAAATTDELARRGEQLHRPALSATAARCGALVLGARGEMDAALATAQRAEEVAAEHDLPFDHARALLVLGDIQRRAKQRRVARESLTAAVAGFDALGAHLWSKKAADSLARIGGRERHEGLTATEAQVAALVSRGLSNKEVAAELFVTVRAVEANLSRIYAKLGVRSRTELASRFSSQGHT